MDARVVKAIDRLLEAADIEGMNRQDFDKLLTEGLKELEGMVRGIPEKRASLMSYAFDAFSSECDSGPILRHARHKPYGYPGDFRLIDAIYENKTCGEGKGELWDTFFLGQAAAEAVRNRRHYFVDQASVTLREDSSVLNLACGPCREVGDVIMKWREAGMKESVTFDCVDIDGQALSYAEGHMKRIGANGHRVRFEKANAFRLRPRVSYDFVWVSGLFDYLDERTAPVLLRKMWRWLGEGGIAIIGNFHPRNPTRLGMEWLCNWFLIHRTEEELERLAVRAGIPLSAVSFSYEPLGINLFMRIRKT